VLVPRSRRLIHRGDDLAEAAAAVVHRNQPEDIP
jgi:hypothetical protein